MSVELRHLRYFVAVAEERHITRAAERLGIRQPPLSQQIKSLERQMGVQLFQRKARGVEPTDAGRVFLDEARAVLSQLDRSLEVTRRTARGEQGRLCVGVTPTAPFHPFVPQVLRRFRQMCPLVALTVEEELSADLVRLRNERIDVAFMRNRLAQPEGLTLTRLFEEEMLAALPASHAHRRDDALTVAQLRDEPFVLYGPPSSGIHDATIAACQRAGFSPLVAHVAPRITSALGLVAAGLGIAMVPESVRCIALDGVTYRRLGGSVQPKAVLNLVSRQGDPSATVRHFVETVRQQRERYAPKGT